MNATDHLTYTNVIVVGNDECLRCQRKKKKKKDVNVSVCLVDSLKYY